MNLKNADYMDNIQVAAYIAIGLDLFVGILSLVLNWRYALKDHFKNSKDTLGPYKMFCGFKLGPFQMCRGFGKAKFLVFTIIIGFGKPLTDTISGKITYSYWVYAQTYSI